MTHPDVSVMPETHERSETEPGSPPPPVSPVLFLVPLGILLGTFTLVVNKLAKPVDNADTYFHVRMGQEFLSSWTPWSPGSVTSYATADWVPSQWLGQVAYGAFDQWFGLPGVAWLSGAVVLLFTVVVYAVTRTFGPLVVSAFLTPAVVLACSPALSGRPQVLSYAFAALVTMAWMRTAVTGRVSWWIIPLTWVWAMVHGMWSVSIVISLVAIVGLLLDRQAIRPRALHLAAIPVLSAVAAGLTPVGPQLYGAVLRVGSITNYFAEWGPTQFTRPATAVAALLMTVLLVLVLRSGPTRWSTLVLVLLAGAWILYSNRTVPVGVAMVAPLLARELSRVIPERARSPRELPAVLIGLALALAALTVATPRTSAEALHQGNAAHSSVAALPAGSGLLNEWDEGGYDMWAHPDLNVVMHGYGDMFTDAELARNFDLTTVAAGWAELVRDLDVRDALLLEDGDLAYGLTQFLGWEVVAEDDGLVHLRAPASWPN